MTDALVQYSSGINEEHRLAFRCARDAVEHAKAAGELLLQAKQEIKHGEWISWLEANCEVSPRVAQSYMRIAENWTAIQASGDTPHGLTIDAALKAIPKPEKPEKAEKPAKPATPEPEPTGPVADGPKTKTTSFLPTNEEDAAPAPADPRDAEIARLRVESKAKDEQLAEMAAHPEPLQDEANLLEKIEGESDKLAAACAEVKRLTALVRVLEERNRGFQNEKNDAIRQAKMWQRKFEQAARKAA